MLIPNSSLYFIWFKLIFLLTVGHMLMFPGIFSNLLLYILNILNDTHFKHWVLFSPSENLSPLWWAAADTSKNFYSLLVIDFHRILSLFCAYVVHLTAKDLGWSLKTDLGICSFAVPCFPIFDTLLFSFYDI